MKLKLKIFTILILFFTDVNAHNPNNDSLCVYIDNVFVGKRCCVDFNNIPSILMENYYCKDLLKCDHAHSPSNDTFSMINPKAIKNIFIEKKGELSVNGNLHIRTKKAKDGYLFVNKYIMDKISNLICEFDKIKISYVYNNKAITTKKDVMQFLGLREKRIQILEIIQDKRSGIITIYFIDKK
ncbi:MAG: hypothetical protein EOL95_08210 [Bacteroidia bacterium]|nr:hypothetical protein [Bacteroidia bacterium]